MPKPFPFPINVGTDICSINRIFRILTDRNGRNGAGFVRRILTLHEREQEDPDRIEEPLKLWQELSKERSSLEKECSELRPSSIIFDTSSPGGVHCMTDDAGLKSSTDREPAVGEAQPGQNKGDLGAAKEFNKMGGERRQLFQDLWKAAEFLAGRFAAKEAAIKAHQSRRLTYHDIMIEKQPLRNGKTQKPIAMIISENGGWEDAQIVPMSISHDGGFATAVCMAYESSQDAVFETEMGVTDVLKSRTRTEALSQAQHEDRKD